MDKWLHALLPEIILCCGAGVLFVMGVSKKDATRRAVPWIALITMLIAAGVELQRPYTGQMLAAVFDTIRVQELAVYVKLLTILVGALFVLMSWPTDQQATANPSLHMGQETGEFFALLLLAIAGVCLVAGANDIIVLFMGIELASIPTYVMVAASRPLPVAQEAGVKYFFLGAMSAAVMLFGFSYLYGATGLSNLAQITEHLASGITEDGLIPPLTPWLMLAVVLIIAGLAFKMAAVPLHFYAGDVYQGAATPVTAMLSFVPKITGFVALIKILYVISAGSFRVDPTIVQLLWIIAVLTMTVGNVLGLLQLNVKRVLAYSSIAHSGYMLVGVTVMVGAPTVTESALQGVLFYLAAYGVMNAGAFGVLMMLPSRQSGYGPDRQSLPFTTAETYEDLAGTARRHPALGLAMAVSCFSLIGLPLTVGFFGKLYLILPALSGGFVWLAVLTLINAAISAAYYLRIVGAMFLRPEPRSDDEVPSQVLASSAGLGVKLAVTLSVVGTLGLGMVLPATEALRNTAADAARFERPGLIAPPVSALR